MKRLFLILLTCMTFSQCFAQLEGLGYADSPYLIKSLADFDEFAGDPAYWYYAHVKLESDIDLTGRTYSTAVIAPDTDATTSGFQGDEFRGTFDGQGYKITGLIVDANDYAGLFGCVAYGASICDLGVENVNVTGNDYVGALGGYFFSGSVILKCYTTGVVSGIDRVGGVAGSSSDNIIRCYSNTSVSGDDYIGGLIGYNYGSILRSYASGDISGDFGTGGLVGYSTSSGIIENCYAKGDVNSTSYAGGLVGYNYGSTSNCYTTGNATGTDSNRVGGFCGKNSGGTAVISNCFWNSETSSATVGATDYQDAVTDNLQGLSTAAMKTKQTYTDSNWDFVTAWIINDGVDYPEIMPLYDWAANPGDGSEGNPYQISTAYQLNSMGSDVSLLDKCFVLLNDIDLNGMNFDSIGGDDGYNGTFDGNGYVISNLTNDQGLFDYVSYNGVIRDLGMANVNVDGGNNSYDTGGLAGTNRGDIYSCYVTGIVNGGNRVGGLIGLAGSGNISDCYSEVNVIGTQRCGGLIGYHDGADISNCYSTGQVTGSSLFGGLIGEDANYVIISACYWDIETSGQSTSAAGQGRTTLEMKSIGNFSIWGCSQSGGWTIDDGIDYPRLNWENKQGSSPVASDTFEGDGTAEAPYLIYTAEELNTIGLLTCEHDKHFKLMADIDLSEYTGTSFNLINNFTGTFDGNSHVISNFTWNSSRSYFTGLFKFIESNGKVHDLGLENVNVNVGTGDYVGTIAGHNQGTISNCYVTGSVSGRDKVGGLAGGNYYGAIEGCYTTGNVSGEDYVGGLAGGNYGFTIENCYSIADVVGNDKVGGIAGDNSGYIYYCYSAGAVTGNTNTGGLVGFGGSNSSDCFWDIQTSGQLTSVGGEGKTTAEMKSLLNYASWACFDISLWTIDEGVGYPRLAWENIAGVPIDSSNFFQGSGTVDDPYLIYTDEELNATEQMPCIEDMQFRLMAFDGSGMIREPYLIYTAEELNKIGTISWLTDKHFRLMADIDLSGYTGASFNRIGGTYSSTAFRGTFDGNGHVISNFTWSSTDDDHVGLFRKVDGAIYDLHLANVNIDAGTGSYVGGIAGSGEGISGCSVAGDIKGGSYVGGFIGHCSENVNECFYSGNVIGDTKVGGFVGSSGGDITDCYAVGTVTGTSQVGGFVGDAVITPSSYNIINCYAANTITGSGTDMGGFAGSMTVNSFNFNDNVINCFWDSEIGGPDNGYGIGLSSAFMKAGDSFTNWDFENKWWVHDGDDYPKLWWQPEPDGYFYLQGSGTAEEPYLIDMGWQINRLSEHPEDWDASFKLTADIDLSMYSFTTAPIAYDANSLTGGFQGTVFTGTFDGNDHVISGLKVTGVDYLGLFGNIDSNGVVKNLALENVDIDALDPPGVDILTTFDGAARVGRFAGHNSGTIRYCSAEGSIDTGHGAEKVGGLVGSNNGAITNCYAVGSVDIGARSLQIGGFAGYNNGIINNCYSVGIIKEDIDPLGGYSHSGSYIGGLVGHNHTEIANCYAAVSMTGSGSTDGGLVGHNDDYMGGGATVIDSYWDSQVTNLNNGTGIGLPTSLMYQQSSFANWDFAGTWLINEGLDYPELWMISPYEGGIGTSGDPYQIATAEQLILAGNISTDWSKSFVLVADINLAGFGSNPDGSFATAVISPDTDNTNAAIFDGTAFSGIFDGVGYKITNLTINSLGEKNDYLGLFGQISADAVISNLKLENATITSDGDTQSTTYIGSLCGENLGTISNCNITGNVTAIYSGYVGGLAGQNTTGTINGCNTNVILTAGDYSGFVGGLVGVNVHGTISNCSAGGSVVGGYDTNWLGGLIGVNAVLEEGQFSEVYNCWSTGDINGGDDSDDVGGLLGQNNGSGATIRNCYSEANVTAGNNSGALGGLCGSNYDSIILDSYATGSVDGANYLGGICGYNSDAGILNCYTTGSIQGDNYIGGICGRHVGSSAIIADTFWNTESSGNSIGYTLSSTTPGVVSNALGKTTIEMQDIDTFLTTGWDFVGETDNGFEDYWRQPNQIGYPILYWQHDLPGDSTGSYGVNLLDFAVFANSWLSISGDSTYNPVCNLDDTGSSADVVDVADLLVFCEYWLEGIYLPSIAGDITKNGSIDSDDLIILASQWLQATGSPSADIAPDPDGDGIVNLLDFALMAENWMK